MEHKASKLKTQRLLLRPLALTDLSTTHAYAGDAENTEYMIYLPNRTAEETEQFLNNVAAERGRDVPPFTVSASTCFPPCTSKTCT